MTSTGLPLRKLTLPELWVFLAVALPVLAALLATLPTVDLAYQLRAGAEILAGHGIPTRDTWTFTAAGLPWLDQQWAAQAVLAGTYSAAGWTGLAVLRAALVAIVCGFILVAIRRTAPAMPRRTAALLTLAAFGVMSPALALRPQLLGMVLFAATLLVLAGRRERPGWLWLLPVIAIAWANVHGSFILAPVLVGLAWLDEFVARASTARRLAIVGVLTLLGTLVNPFGVGVWKYALDLSTNHEVTARISEWQPPTLGTAFGALFWVSVVLVAVGAVLLVRRRGRVPWVALLTLAGFVVLGAMAERGIAWWPGIAAVTLAGMTVAPRGTTTDEARPAGSRPERASALNSAVVAVLALACVALVPAWRPIDPGLGAPTGLLGQAPSGITRALRDIATPADRVWNPQLWGSWFEFAVPAPRYAFDARIEVIPTDAWAQGVAVEAVSGDWSQVLTGAGVSIVVTRGAATLPLPAALAASDRWRSLYADDDGAIWVRSDR